jgi:hypothetical protein
MMSISSKMASFTSMSFACGILALFIGFVMRMAMAVVPKKL